MASQNTQPGYHLYGISRAGSVMIEYLLAKGGIPYTVSFPTPEDRAAPSFRAHSPRGQIPLLITPEGEGISESLAIILYLLDRHPDIGLMPPQGDPARAKTLQWLSFLAVNLYTANQRYYQTSSFKGDQDAIRKGGYKDRNHIYDELDTVLSARGPYLAGSNLTAADIYLYMFLNWDRKTHVVLSAHPHLARLYHDVDALDYVAAINARQP